MGATGGFRLPPTRSTTLSNGLQVHAMEHHGLPMVDFDLIVRVNGKELLRKPVSKQTATNDPWLIQQVDLSPFAGQKVAKIELINQPSGWFYEAAYWAEIAIVSE